VLALMNAEHPDAIRLYARHFGGKKKAEHASLIHVSDRIIRLTYRGPGNDAGELSLPYIGSDGEHVVLASIGDCRRVLVAMARIASEALGEPINLPEVRNTDLPGGAGLGNTVSAPPAEVLEFMRQMQQMKGLAEEGRSDDNPSNSGATAGTVINPGSSSSSSIGRKPARADLFLGEGSRLGGSEVKGVPPIVGSEASSVQPQLREVDPDKPVVRLRVQLLDRCPAQVMVNLDFTVRELRAWLQHHMMAVSDPVKEFSLMDVGGFPPRKFADLDATVDELKLSGSSTLACRPA